jgi:hypothetical protein
MLVRRQKEMGNKSDWLQYSTTTQRRIFELKSNRDLVQLWINAQATLNIMRSDLTHDTVLEMRAIKVVELCDYALARRGLCMTLDGGTWTDAPIPMPPLLGTQAEIPF